MGILNFTTGHVDSASPSGTMSSQVISSGSYTTSTTASFIEASGTDIEMRPGQTIVFFADEPMWVRFGGVAATVGGGHYIPANIEKSITCREAGKVSAIDVS